jgi:hypothetical protein
MNEILAVIVICLASELVWKLQDDVTDEDSSDEDNLHVVERNIFRELHNPSYLWADAYSLFERVMDLGIKELYYKDV